MTDTIHIDEYNRRYVNRFVITQLDSTPGWRVLAQAAQGRNTYATESEAQQHLDAIMSNNSAGTLASVFRLPLKVLPCRCYPNHYDPLGHYFEEAEQTTTK